MRLSRHLAWAIVASGLTAGLVASMTSCEQIIGLEPGELRPGGSAPTTSQGAAGAGGHAAGGNAPGGSGGHAAAGGVGGAGGSGGSGGDGGQPEPRPLAVGESDPTLIAVDADYAFWTSEDASTVRRVPIAGGTPVTMATTLSNTLSIGVFAGRVYWTVEEGASEGVWSLPVDALPGTEAQAMSGAYAHPYGLAALSSIGVAWTELGDGVFWFNGTSVAPLATGQGGCTMTAMSASHAYWIAAGNIVRRADFAGTTGIEEVVVAAGPVGALAVAGDTAFWTESGASARIMKRVVHDDPLEGLPVASNLTAPVFVAVHETDVYWTDSGESTDDGGVMHCGAPYPCTIPTVLAAGQQAPYGIAVDEQNVYWTDKQAGEIWTIRRQ